MDLLKIVNWCFTSVSTVFKSYEYGRIIMKDCAMKHHTDKLNSASSYLIQDLMNHSQK